MFYWSRYSQRIIIKDKLPGDSDLLKLDITCTFQDVTAKILNLAREANFDFIGHRVVHGGETFKTATELNDDVLRDLQKIDGDFIQYSKQRRCVNNFRSGSTTQSNPKESDLAKFEHISS